MWILSLVIFLVGLCVSCEKMGHLKPLGEQRESEGHIEVLNDVLDSVSFFENYVKVSKPVVFKGGALQIPAFNKWNDDYIKKTFGHINVDVEEGKKENRSLGMWTWTYKEFIEKYQNEDVYMVNSLKPEMRSDLVLFPSISCGGFANVLTDVIMWFSSGGTKSVVHTDHIDNINCLFSGTKTLYMVDPKYQHLIEFDAGSHSYVDVDAVDLNKYPGIADAPWWEAKMKAGDCLFIPSKWIHQVRSFAENKRNMAVNVWFHHLNKMNYTDCEKSEHADQYVSLDKFQFANSNGIRFILNMEVENGPVSYKEMMKFLRQDMDYIRKSIIKEFIIMLDKDGDKMISREDIAKLDVNELNALSQLFSGFEKVEQQVEDTENQDLYGEDEILLDKDEL